jgi:hypothetical protein
VDPRQHARAAFCRFIIYDETATVDERKNDRARYEKGPNFPIPPGVDREVFINSVLDNADKMNRHLWRSAYGHPHLCWFTVYENASTEFEFDSDKHYKVEELKEIMRRATRVKRRCKPYWEKT